MTCNRKLGPFQCCSVVQGDCLDLMKQLPDGCVDAVITDPPYGVGFTGKAGHYRNQPNAKRDDTYDVYEDSPENFSQLIIPRIVAALKVCKCAAVFMASRNVFLLPAGELGGIFLPNGCGRSTWGFQTFMHCVFYGSDPYTRSGMGSRPNGKYGLYSNDANEIKHPCAKPERAMLWAVERASLNAETILDPFCGSGTTLVAAAKLGRHFLGFEISEDYCRIARERIARVEAQPNLFQPKAEQIGIPFCQYPTDYGTGTGSRTDAGRKVAQSWSDSLGLIHYREEVQRGGDQRKAEGPT